MNNKSKLVHRNRERVLGLILLLVTIGVYWQVQHHDFIYLDDPAYVTDNRYVKAGLTKEGFVWAFSTFSISNWHPLTWLSHMLDGQLYGCNPAGHHLTSLFFHVANTLLLFLFLRQATGRLWQSFIVAGLFALHPLHIESVAWISERKDVLSTFFWMLAMIAYVRYVQAPRISRYVCIIVLFVLGLLSKPMVVTLPFVLILLDYWPLGRIKFKGKIDAAVIWRLVWEKIPFFVLSAVSCIVTVMAQSGAIRGLKSFPLDVRLLNALVSYVRYILKMLWPQDLAFFYPHPGNTVTLWSGLASALFLGLLAAVSIREIRRRPYIFVGFFWFIGTMIPVIGLVQVGMQAMADRYTYIPLIGLFLTIVWGLSDLFEPKKVSPVLKVIFSGTITILLAASTCLQLRHWHDTRTLSRHALSVTRDNYAAHFMLARAEGERGAMDKALHHYNIAVKINPAYIAMIHNRVGYYLVEQGRLEEAMSQFTGALEIRPDYANAHNNLGVVLARKGRFDEAISQIKEALKVLPGYTEAKKNLENVRREKERIVQIKQKKQKGLTW